MNAQYDADYYGAMMGPTVNFSNNLSISLVMFLGGILYMLSQNGMALKFASQRLRDNLEIVFTALAKDVEAGRFMGDEVRKALRNIPDRFLK